MDEEELGIEGYNSSLDLYELAKDPANSQQGPRRVQTGSTEVGRNTGFGDSMFDENFFPNISLNADGSGGSLNEVIDENRAQNQPWIAKASAGTARVGTKALAEIAKMPGVLGGIAVGAAGQIADGVSGEDNTDFMQVAFNNGWINAINDVNDYVNNEALPVYVKKAVKDGNLWDNVKSIDFWATEGADGLGYIVSMLAPGAVINRLGVGNKIFAGLKNYGLMGNKVDDATTVLANSKFGITPNNIDVGLSTVANTLFEAGAEAQGAMEGYKQELDFRQLLAEDHPDYISPEEYDELVSKQSEVGRDVFLANSAILIGPNAIMAKMIWGKVKNKAAQKLVKESGAFTKLPQRTLLQKVKGLGDDFGKATLREGFFEEGMQSTAEEYASESYLHDKDYSVGDFAKSYLEMLKTTDGQKAILLGGVFGGGMQGYYGHKSRKSELEQTNKLVDIANSVSQDFYNTFNDDVYVRNKDTDEIMYTKDEKTGELVPKVDPMKVIEKMQSLDEVERQSALYDYHLLTGNKEAVEQLRDAATTNMVLPFVTNDALGLDILEQHLNTTKDIDEISKKENVSKASVIKDIMDKAKHLKEAYTTFDEFAPSLIKLEDKNATEEDTQSFYNQLSMQYVFNKGRKHYLDKKKTQIEQNIDKVLAERGRSRAELEDNASLYNSLPSMDVRFKALFEQLSAVDSSIEQRKKADESMWDGKAPNKQFKEFVKKSEILRKEVAKEKEVEDTLNKIKGATTSKEIDEIEVPDTIASEVISQAKEARKAELLKAKDAKVQDAVKESEEVSDQTTTTLATAEERFNYIKDNYNEGETVTLTEEFPVPDKFKKDAEGNPVSVTVTKIEGNRITIEAMDGTTTTISSTSLTKEDATKDINFETEGGVHAADLPGNNDNKQDSTKEDRRFTRKNNARVYTTNEDKKTGEVTKPDFISQAALDFERTPTNKKNKKVGFTINENPGNSKKLNEALAAYKAGDFSNLDLLIDYLPLNTSFVEGVEAPLETKSEASGKYNGIFKKTSRVLRSAIVKELAKGTKIEDLSTTIAGQKSGQLQVAEKVNGKVVENAIHELYEFAGDVSKVKATSIYIGDDTGTLRNYEGEQFPGLRRRVSPGEVYLTIHRADGVEFPLKLNIAKLSETKAELVYEIYKYRLEAGVEEGKGKKISETSPELQEAVNTLFSEELKLFKNSKDLTIKDVLDFLIFDGSKNTKSQVRIYAGKLKVLNEEFTKEQLADPNIKKRVIKLLTENKRHNIKYKRRPGEGTDSMNLQNKAYVRYILESKTLNTNAVVGEPTFQGSTSIYLHTNKVKVDNSLSEFNEALPRTYAKTLIGTNSKLKEKILPSLFKNPVELNPTKNVYEGVDKDGNVVEYERVSNVVGDKFDGSQANVYNAAKRGDVIDELTREFFSTGFTSIEQFITAATATKEANGFEGHLTRINKERTLHGDIAISDEALRELYLILEEYKIYFDSRNFTVFANSPTLTGTLIKNGKEVKVAGTMDLLAYDNTNRNWYIIDLKTTSTDRYQEYLRTGGFNYRLKDQKQQNAYAELFEQMTKIKPAGLFILPITATSSDPGTNAIYDSFKRTSSEKPFLQIDNSKSIYELMGETKASAVETPKRKGGASSILAKMRGEKTEGTADEYKADSTEEAALAGDLGKPNAANVLAKLGLGKKKGEAKKAAEPTKPKTVPTPSKMEALSPAQEEEAMAALAEGRAFVVDYEGQEYYITHGTYYVYKTEGEGYPFVLDMKTIGDVIKYFDEFINTDKKKVFKDAQEKWKQRLKPTAEVKKPTIVKESEEKALISEEKDVSLQKEELTMTDEIDFANMDTAQVNKAMGTIMKTIDPALLQDLLSIKGSNPQDRLKKIYAYLLDKELVTDEITENCRK